MPAETFKVISIRDVPSGEPTRIGKIDVMVVYQKEGQPASMTTYPKEEESEDRIKKAIKDAEDRQKQFQGKEFIIE